jgi:1-acyl-sn-glycerol-3-phosphate acyltransferase
MSTRLRHLDHALRTLATLGIFGAWVFVVGRIVLPLRRWWRPGTVTDLVAQRSMHEHARAFLRWAAWTGVARVRIEGAERLSAPGPHLVVANHPSLIDIVILTSVMPQADCIVNRSRAAHLSLMSLVRAGGHVHADSGHRIVRQCSERLAAGRNLVVFPEGTRSPVGALGPFARGAARIALESGCDLHPVVLTYDPPTLAKGRKWYDLPRRRIEITARVLDPLSTSAARGQLAAGCSRTVAARNLTAELRETFLKELSIADARNA